MNVKFRVLYRQFLFRLIDVELLSASAGGDASALLGQFASLLIFGSILLSLAGFGIGGQARLSGLPVPVWTAERFMVSVTMLVAGVFALLNWESAFPDRNDALVLAPLPVRAGTLLSAKIAAAAFALALTLMAWNSLAGFVWPLALSPDGAGFLGTMRLVGSFWAGLMAAGTFLYCAVLCVQAAAARLPRAWYQRISPLLQVALFITFLGFTFLQPSLNTLPAFAAPENQWVLHWLPAYWFMGLISELSGAFPVEGHAVMAPLALRAAISVPIAMCTAGGAFLLSYYRTLGKIVEELDVVPVMRGGVPLPRFGSQPQTALAHFVLRTLLRSRRHRTILALYLGGGFAVSAVSLEVGQQAMHMSWTDLLERVGPPLLFASAVMLCASWLGTRAVFSLPLDLRTNWLFRVIPTPALSQVLPAIRRALLTSSVLPVLTAFAALLLWFWPWAPGVEHLLLLWLIGSLLVDISLKDFQKIPFTCSYLPGKTKAHIVFWFGIIPLVVAIDGAVGLEERALANPWMYWATAATLAAVAFAARRVTDKSANQNGPEIEFEESPSDQLILLDLGR